jgi:hypothetical protein
MKTAVTRMPRLIDRADAKVLGGIVVISLLALWIAAMAGLVVRVFLITAFGGA